MELAHVETIGEQVLAMFEELDVIASFGSKFLEKGFSHD